MILVIDIGNTNIKFGVYDSDKLEFSFRIATDSRKTGDEYGAIMRSLFLSFHHNFSDIDGIIMSSVAPTLNYTIDHVCRVYFGIEPIVVEAGVKTGINIKYQTPQRLGADRLVNAVSAMIKYGGPCIVVDFGTATTFSIVSRDKQFIGGAICPGIKTSMDSLVSSASKLPLFELRKPDKVIGKTTISNMQSGFVNGFFGMVEYMIEEFREEMNEPNALVIATGGLSQLMLAHKRKIIDIIDRDLTLNGLKYIYDLNTEKEL